MQRHGKQIIKPSRLGLRFLGQHGVDEDLVMLNGETARNETRWEQPWGERRFILDRHNELLIEARRREPDIRVNIRLRAFDDGLGFRYELPEQAGLKGQINIIDELTEFGFDTDTQVTWIPSGRYNRYEYLYKSSPIMEVFKAHTPVTMKLPSGVHVSVHEAALVDYTGMSLTAQNREGVFKADLSPRSDGLKAVVSTPFVTPWRTIQIADDAVGLINSDLILNLNAPNKLGDVSWFKPGKYVGIWWHQHIKERIWGNDGIHAATTELTKEMIDFAARYGFTGVLVEGWNIGWDGDWFNNGDLFSFTQSYPDFDLAQVAAYGKEKNVFIVGHHETSGNISNYEKQLEDALDLYAKHDVKVIKTGYVADAGNIKRVGKDGVAYYEWHDNQHLVDHHLHVVKRAAEHKIAINPHEPVKDTGLRRTYPNWVSREGARGQEFNAWGVPPNGPDHVPYLVFTRMLSGPMDYTAGAFDLRPNERPPVRSDMPRNDKRSRIEHTLAKELALYVVIYSPIQMVMDLPENYKDPAKKDAFQFIVDVPVDWEDSRALQGEVGDYVVIARKDRNSENWYLGAVTDAAPRNLEIPLEFLPEGQLFDAVIYRDGPQAHYEQAPYDYEIVRKTGMNSADSLSIRLAPGGGAAVQFVAR